MLAKLLPCIHSMLMTLPFVLKIWTLKPQKHMLDQTISLPASNTVCFWYLLQVFHQLIKLGSWSVPLKKGKAPNAAYLNSNQQEILEDLDYSTEDIKHVEEWVKVSSLLEDHLKSRHTNRVKAPRRDYLALSWNLLDGSSRGQLDRQAWCP